MDADPPDPGRNPRPPAPAASGAPDAPDATARRGPLVAVVGSLNADLVLPVDHLPAAGETVLTSAAGRQVFGGKGANQAAAAAAFGAEVLMVGRVGDDEAGRQIRADLADLGVDVSQVTVTAGARSGYAAIAVDPAGENLIIVDPGANLLLTAEDVRTADLGAAAVVLVQLEIPLAAVSAASWVAGGARVVLNPAPVPATAVPQGITELADVIVPNRTELAQLAGGAGGGVRGAGGEPAAGFAELVRLARALPGKADVVVTLGREGALVVPRSGGPPVHIAAPAVTAVDTTGAGDCFCGTLAVSLARGLELTAAVRQSVAAAAISTTGHGARGKLPGPAEVAQVAESLEQRAVG